MTATPGGGLRHDGDEDNFVIIPRPTIRDDRLSFKARGLLAFILDLPTGWDVRATWLVTQGSEGREAIYGALQELRAAGYYRIERRQVAGGRWSTGTAVSKTARPAWAAEYAEQEAARAAKRVVPEPVVTVLDDGSVVEGEVPTDVRVPVSRSDVREADDREADDRSPVVPTEELPRRSEKEGVVEEVSHLGGAPDLDAPSPELPDGVLRFCPEHRLAPALGPCTPCGVWRRAVEAADEQRRATERAAAEVERRRRREAAVLAETEQTVCTLCDAEGTASVRIDGQPKPVTLKCLHDGPANVRSVQARLAAPFVPTRLRQPVQAGAESEQRAG